jgi:hypothetical protein
MTGGVVGSVGCYSSINVMPFAEGGEATSAICGSGAGRTICTQLGLTLGRTSCEVQRSDPANGRGLQA